jgi:hypothetical protein
MPASLRGWKEGEARPRGRRARAGGRGSCLGSVAKS